MAKSKKVGADNALAPVAGIEMLAIHELVNSPTNPRKTYSIPELEELARSIRDHGLINPITVRPVYNDVHPNIRSWYEVVAGNRRFKAAQIADMEFVPCIVRELSDDQVLDIQIDENLHRQDVPPLEEADAFKSLLDAKRISINELAARLNKSAAYIYRRIKLTNLSDKYRPHLQSGALPVTTAEIFASYPQEAQEVIYKNVCYTEGERVIFYDSRNVRSRLESQTCNSLQKAIWPLDHVDMQPGLQACTTCEKNTAVATLLFPDGADAPRCTDKACWNIKQTVWMALSIQQWKAYCKKEGIEEVYADLYFYSYDKKPYEKIFDGSEKVLGKFDYEIVDRDYPGAFKVLFIGGSSWDEEKNSWNFKVGYIALRRKSSGERIDWEMDKILKDETLTQEEKDRQVKLLAEKRQRQRTEQEVQHEQKQYRLRLIEKCADVKPDFDAELLRIFLYRELLDQQTHTRKCWHVIFSEEAQGWRPDSFLKEHYDNGEWNAMTVDAWVNMLEEKGEITPFDVWNDLLTEEEMNQFVIESLSKVADYRLNQMFTISALYKIYDRLGNWNDDIPTEPVVRFAKHVGIDTDKTLEDVKQKIYEKNQGKAEADLDDDEYDYDLNEDDE
jgi:ParB/RepB/Spo0J family partition protein